MAEQDKPQTQKTQPRGVDPKTGKPFQPIEIPVPTREDFDRALKRVVRPADHDKRDPHA